MTRSNAGGLRCPSGERAPSSAAQPTRTSSRPKRSASAPPSWSIAGPFARSSGTRVALPPAARTRSSTSSSAPGVRATSTRTAPSAAKRSARAAPRPRLAPVISAIRSRRRASSTLLEHQRELIGAAAATEILEQGRIVAAEAGVAELGLGSVPADAAHRAIEAVQGQELQAVDPDDPGHGLEVVLCGQKLAALRRVDAVEARVG